MATYRQADAEARGLIADLICQYHGSLAECDVRVGCLLAFAPSDPETGEVKDTPALKKYGLPTLATVRIVSQRDRVAGLPDAQIVVDGELWEREWSDERKRAVLDRQLQHLEVQMDDDGNVKIDDCSRPKLRIVPPDYLISGFIRIAERHGEASLEVQEARQLAKVHGQLLFDFAVS